MQQITFCYKDKQFTTEISLVNRKKLYGWTEIKHFDDKGNEVRKIHLDSNGIVKMEEKSTSFQYFDKDGNNIEKKKDVFAPDEDSKPKTSSFEGGVDLEEVGCEYLLGIDVGSVYEVSGLQTGKLLDFMQDRIFTFSFAYNRNSNRHSAYLVANEGRVFILVADCDYRCPYAPMLTLKKEIQINVEDFANLRADELDFYLM